MGRTLSKFFAWLLQHRRITSNPCIGVWKPSAPQARERVLTDTEIRLFWQATDDLGAPFGPLLKLLLLTGQRLGEVSGMRRDELHDDGTWHLPGSRTKNHKHHIVPLPALAHELIGSVPIIEDCPLVFSTNGLRPVSGWSKTKARLDVVMRVLAKKEIMRRGRCMIYVAPPSPAWPVSALRRTWSRRWSITSAELRQASPACTIVRSTAAERKAALERWAQHVQGLGGGKPSNVVDMPSKKRKRP